MISMLNQKGKHENHDLFGDYSLNEFKAIDSDRLIIISRKINN